MIILTETTDKIKISLSSNVQTNQYHCYASYRDITSNSIEPKRSLTLTNNTTSVDLVGSPASSHQYVIDYISVYNNDTISGTVSVLFEDNSTSYEIFKGKLDFGDKLEYQDKIGFRTSNYNGNYKTSIFYQDFMNINATDSNTTMLTTTVTNTNSIANTLADVPGLSFSVVGGSNYYYFKFFLYMATNASANGVRVTINGPSYSFLNYRVQTANNTTTYTYFEGLNVYDSSSLATSLPTTLLGNSILEGVISPNENGNVVLRFASELAGPTNRIDMREGSFVQYQKIN